MNYPFKEVCTGFVGVKKSVIDKLDLDNAPKGMEFSSWFLTNVTKYNECNLCHKLKKKHLSSSLPMVTLLPVINVWIN